MPKSSGKHQRGSHKKTKQDVHRKSKPIVHDRKYVTFNYPAAECGDKTLLTGIREIKNEIGVYITGFFEPADKALPVIAFVYKGKLNGDGTWYEFNYPSSQGVTVVATNLYGPDNGIGDTIKIVGNYTTEETGQSTIGCLYEGTIDGDGEWTTLVPTTLSNQPILNTIAHSVMGNYVVGNYDTQLKQGMAFIYDIKKKVYYNITNQFAKSITAYGIWHNEGHSYTICGGYSIANGQGVPNLDSSYLVDWDSKLCLLTNWRSYNYDNDPVKAIVSHFDGITSDGKGGYYLTGDWFGFTSPLGLGFVCHIDAIDGTAKWENLSYPKSLLTSGNSICGKDIAIGVYTAEQLDTVNGFISY